MSFTAEEWDRLASLLDATVGMSAAERATLLDQLSADAPHLATHLKRLLMQEERLRTQSVNDSHLATASPPAHVELHENAVVGPYRLLRLLGRGGMGEVWLAERTDGSMKRQVALKFPFTGANQHQIKERLRREREILSSLEHPNIARLYDAAETDCGQPYLVIEYVAGKPICEYCDQHTLTVRQRIELFLRVLNAVQYAHARLIVHRDLKPSNVLVAGNGEPYLLDFGIAKLLQGDATPTPGVTREFGVALTPEYAAPEQFLGLPVTTATDVYSLGLLLYQLLAGKHARDIATTDPRSAIEWVTAREPRKISHAVTDSRTQSYAKLAEVAAMRGSSPEALRKLLRGDIDTIAAKALAIEPEDRYTSVASLADDLQRHLCNEPIGARAPTLHYRIGKFARRHRVSVIAAALTMIALSTATAVALWQARVAESQRNRAIAMADRNVAINAFLYTVVMDVTRTGAPISTRQMLERSESLAKKAFAHKPEHQAAILESLASAFRTLGDLNKAARLLDEAATMAGQSSDATLRAEILCHRGWVMSLVDDAQLGKEAINAVLRMDAVDPLTQGSCIRYLAFIAQDTNDSRAMLKHAQHAREIARQSLSYSPEWDASFLASIAAAHESLGMIDQADKNYAAALTTLEALGLDRSPNTLAIRSNRAVAIMSSGNPLPALEQYDAILRVLKQDDPTSAAPPNYLANRAAVLENLGRYTDALAQYQEAYQVARELSNERWLAYSLAGLGDVSRKLGELKAAKQYVAQIETTAANGIAKGNAAWHRFNRLRIRLALADGDVERARTTLDELTGTDSTNVSPDSWHCAAEVEMAAGNLDIALTHARASLQQAQQRQGGMAFSSAAGTAWLMIGHIQSKQGDSANALKAFRNAVEQLSSTVDATHPALREAKYLSEQRI